MPTGQTAIVDNNGVKAVFTMERSYLDLIGSTRVGERTREVLVERAQPIDPSYKPQTVSHAQFATLDAIVQLLIPQDNAEEPVDIAAAFDRGRSMQKGDGWRYANMPPDDVALGIGLASVESTAQFEHACPFHELDAGQQTALLHRIQLGAVMWTQIDAKRWFEDLLAEVTEIYVALPSTLAAIGFSGIAFLPRWPEVGLDTARSWEPVSIPDRKSGL